MLELFEALILGFVFMFSCRFMLLCLFGALSEVGTRGCEGRVPSLKGTRRCLAVETAARGPSASGAVRAVKGLLTPWAFGGTVLAKRGVVRLRVVEAGRCPTGRDLRLRRQRFRALAGCGGAAGARIGREEV